MTIYGVTNRFETRPFGEEVKDSRLHGEKPVVGCMVIMASFEYQRSYIEDLLGVF